MTVRRGLARAGAVAAAAAVLGALTAAPAEAALSRTYGKSVVVELVEVGSMAGAPGDVHYGHLEFYRWSTGAVSVLGYVFHADCPDEFAVSPTATLAEATAAIEGACQRFIDGTESLETGEVEIRMTKDQRHAHVTGYFDSSLPTQPQVAFSLDLRGVGDVTETVETSRQPGSKTITTHRDRAATAMGTIGSLVLGDQPGDLRLPASTRRTKVKTFTW